MLTCVVRGCLNVFCHVYILSVLIVHRNNNSATSISYSTEGSAVLIIFVQEAWLR